MASDGFSDSLFRGKVIVVTGAGHGIGQAALLKGAKLGASVVALEIDANHLSQTRAQLDAIPADALLMQGDVGDGGFLASAITQIQQRWGRLDGWVNNAYATTREPIAEFDIARFTRAWEINVRAPMQAAALALPLFSQTGGGAIVNISSVLAHRVRANEFAYASSKSALEGLTRILAHNLAKSNVRVNCVIPGAIRVDPIENAPANAAVIENENAAAARQLRDLLGTNFQPLRQIGQPDDVANSVLFLLSDLAKFITGTSLVVDGGFLIDGAYIGDETFANLIRECDRLRARTNPQ